MGSDPTNAWSVDQSTGKVNVNFYGDVDLRGNNLLNVAAIVSQNGLWRLDENGRLTTRFIETEYLTVGSVEKPTGITLFDQTTKQPYCITVNNGAVVSSSGNCESLEGASPSLPTSTSELTPEPPLEPSSEGLTGQAAPDTTTATPEPVVTEPPPAPAPAPTPEPSPSGDVATTP